MVQIGDKVILKSDQRKIVYIVEAINEETVVITGYIYRIKRETSLALLEPATDSDIKKEEEILKISRTKITRKAERVKPKAIFGTILHIDGDEKFLNNCLNLYKEMDIHCWGIHLKEKEVKFHIEALLEQLTPDIVVITGHDFYNGKDIKDLNNYENSKEFIETLRIIRKKFSIDNLTVIIGACESHFEALIANGANFASSPKRINIHTYDPAVIAIKCATTSFNRVIDFENTLKFIENGRSAFGGIETKGKMRLLL